MKQNLRKILAVLTLSTAVLGLTACGSAADEGSDITYDQAYLQSVADFLVQNWDAMSEEEIDQYATMDAEDAQEIVDSYGLPFTADSFTSAFAGYEGSVDDLGAYVSTDSYEPATVDGDEITLVTNLTYESRTATLSIVFNKKSVVQSVTLDPKYSMGEIFEKAAMNTIIGMGTVFIVLIFLSILIWLLGTIVPRLESGKKKSEAPKKEAPKAAPAAPAAAAPAEEPTDDGELVAAIAAAISAYSGMSSDSFVVRSIRRADSAKWKRA